MSRSALWRQAAGVKERELHASGVLENAIIEARQRPQKGLIALTRDDTFNFNPMLLQNISKSPYFLKCCSNIHDWNGLVDEIYYECKHMEPWTQGHVKTPSTAFCLLLRLFTLRCSEKQMTLMLNHVDSPYIRCIGFLYLRYGANATDVWERFQPFLYDEEPLRISAKMTQKETTVGEYVRSLLTDMEYCGTLLPRLPVAVERDIKVKLMQAEKIEERALKHLKDRRNMSFFETMGSRIQALYGDEDNPVTWYDAIVDRVVRIDDETGEKLARPKFLVTFPEYGNTETVSLGEIDMAQSKCERGNQANNETPDNRDGTWNRDRNQEHHKRGHHGDQHAEYNDRGYGRNSNENDRRYDSKRVKYDDNYHDSHRNNHSRDYDAPTTSSASTSRYVANEKDLMEEVLKRERDKSAAKGKAYASRPATFKESLSTSSHGVHHRHVHGSAIDTDQEKRKPLLKSKNEQSQGKAEPKPKTAEELGAIAVKKRQLLARYG